MKRASLILLALLIVAPACEKKSGDTEAETAESADEKTEEPESNEDEKAASKTEEAEPEPLPATDESNEPGGFRTPTQIALRELPFEPCEQVHKSRGSGDLIRTFVHEYEDGNLMKKLDLTADGTVRAAWSYEYDDKGQRIRAMRDDAPGGEEMVEPDLIISYKWSDGKLTNSAWAFAKEPDKTYRNSFEYDDEGKLVKVDSEGFPIDPPRDDNEPRVWSFEYDDKGYLMRRTRRSKKDDAPARKTMFRYKDGKMVAQTHTADIQGESKMQYDAAYTYEGDQLAQQVLEWGYKNYGTELITYKYECE